MAEARALLHFSSLHGQSDNATAAFSADVRATLRSSLDRSKSAASNAGDAIASQRPSASLERSPGSLPPVRLPFSPNCQLWNYVYAAPFQPNHQVWNHVYAPPFSPITKYGTMYMRPPFSPNHQLWNHVQQLGFLLQAVKDMLPVVWLCQCVNVTPSL